MAAIGPGRGPACLRLKHPGDYEYCCRERGMATDEGVGKSSESESQPPRRAVVGSARPVFISYASHDVAVAQKVCAALEAAGYLCWIAPRNVIPGTMYADGIVHAIDASSILVLILSAQAVASAHVGREIERAVSKRHPVVALRIDGAPLTAAFEYFLNQSQWIEGRGSDAAIAQLVGAVGQHLAPGTEASPTKANQASIVHRKTAMPRRVLIIAAAVVAVILAGGYFLDRAWRSSQATIGAISDKSIAVLPFTDMSEKQDQEYFADGMAEETLNQLAKIPGLKVIGRTSSFQFKQKADDLRKIGTTLGVAYVLEGSVRRSGDRLRVTAQLIDTRDGARRWSDSYDRSASDALAVQDQIAAGLARALQLEVNMTPRRSPRSAEAYDSYLRGLHAREGYDQAGFEKAVADFKRTLQLDPDFVPAAEALARVLFEEASWYFLPPQVGFEQARTAATAALRLDAKSALAHVLLGSVHIWYDWDWPSAAREMRMGMMLAPNDPDVLEFAAEEPLAVGRWDEAARLYRESLSSDPLQAPVYQVLGWTYERLGRFAEAESVFRRAREISPTYVEIHHDLGTVLLLQGKPDAALREMERETPLGGRSAGLAIVYHALHRDAEGDAELSKLESEHSGDMAMWIAEAHAFRGEKDIALSWLDRAYAQKDIFLWLIKGDPLFRNLEGDPRYKAFLKKMNLPEG
jgi:TolB-like protein/predicted Zn-dependent protease